MENPKMTGETSHTDWRELRKKRKKRKEEKVLEEVQKQQESQQKLAKQKLGKETLANVSTLSIAVPGSILDNAQSRELRTYLVGQIARAACIFQADEIVVFDDHTKCPNVDETSFEDINGMRSVKKSCALMMNLLQYLECPQYLRKALFPKCRDFEFVGLLNPLDTPHHLRRDDKFPFREGVVTEKPSKTGRGSYVDIGLLSCVAVDKLLDPGLRVTVKISPGKEGSKKDEYTVVAPSRPRAETGVYWGYDVRVENSLTQVFMRCPYEGGYDVKMGTSDKGTPLDSLEEIKYKHAIVVFGGLEGLDIAIEGDTLLDTDDPKLVFDHYVNTIPSQGCRTVRTEEAILVSLAALRKKLVPETKPKEFDPSEFSEPVAKQPWKKFKIDLKKFD